MRAGPYSAVDLLEDAAACAGRSATEAAVRLAASWRADPDLAASAGLSIGQRDRTLCAMREALFGGRLDLGAACPACGARLAVSLAVRDLAGGSDPAPGRAWITVDGRPCRLRVPDSRDLAALAAIPDPAEGRRALAGRCLVPLDGGPPPALDLAALGRVAAALAGLDPAADPYVPLACTACGLAWDTPVDIAAVLAAEIGTAAERLIDDVHDLALAYHWSEAAILALPAERRRAYLERLRA